MSKSKGREQYVEELAIKNPDIELVGDYVDMRTKATHHCKKHDITWNITPDNALRGVGCKECGREKIIQKSRKSEEDYIKELAIKNPTVKLTGKYINSNTPVEHYCEIHDIFWNAEPLNTLQGNGCNQCRRDRISNALMKSEEEYIFDLQSKNLTTKLIGKYAGAYELTKHYCEIHDEYFDVTPVNALHGFGCPGCRADRIPEQCRPKSEEQYIQDLEKIHPHIKLTGKYINSATPTWHECLIHHLQWQPMPGNLLSGKGCPRCRESKGEKDVAQWLEQNKIIYDVQKKFDDCKDKQPLPFDFYLPDYNTIIEYNGKQHYESVDYFGGEEGFKLRQYHDKIKDNYCLSQGIRLIWIPYWEDVNEYLNNNLLI